MKTLFSLILAIVIGNNTCFSQNLQVSESPFVTSETSTPNPHLVVNDHIRYIESYGGTWQIKDVNSNDKSVKTANFRVTDNPDYVATAYLLKESSILFFFELDEKTTYTINVIEVDLNTKKELSQSTLVEYLKLKPKKRNVMLNVGMSSNEQFCALQFIEFHYSKSEKSVVADVEKIVTMNTKLETVYTSTIDHGQAPMRNSVLVSHLRAHFSMALSNTGEVLTTMRSVGKTANAFHLFLCHLDGTTESVPCEKDLKYTDAKCAFLNGEFSWVGVTENRALNLIRIQINGASAPSSIQLHGEGVDLIIRKMHKLEQGDLIIVLENKLKEQLYTGEPNKTFEYIYGDLTVVAINPNGNITWEQEISKKLHAGVSGDAAPTVGVNALIYGENLMLLWNENYNHYGEVSSKYGFLNLSNGSLNSEFTLSGQVGICYCKNTQSKFSHSTTDIPTFNGTLQLIGEKFFDKINNVSNHCILSISE